MNIKLQIALVIIGFGFSLYACQSPQQKENAPHTTITDPTQQTSLIDSLRETTPINRHPRQKPIDFDAFKVLRKIIQEESNNYFKKPFDLVTTTITHPDSISAYQYLSLLFKTEAIESITFDGNINNHSSNKYFLPISSMLTLKFNQNEAAKKAMNQLNEYRAEDRRAITDIFKPGGMAFVLENQLCLYSVNTCSKGYKNVQRIDSIIFQNVFYNENFDRLHAGCGMGPFKRLAN